MINGDKPLFIEFVSEGKEVLLPLDVRFQQIQYNDQEGTFEIETENYCYPISKDTYTRIISKLSAQGLLLDCKIYEEIKNET